MLTDFLQNQAALYVSGAMTAEERKEFELIIEFHDEVRECVTGLLDVGAALTLATQRARSDSPSSGLKSRIVSLAAGRPQQASEDPMVMTGPDGLVQWVNPAFTAMCGYSFAELRGRKPGHLLQGPDTDPAALDRIRAAVTARRSCCETVVNYHRNGSRYLAEISITPILDDDDQPVWFAAKERILGVA